MTLREKIAVMIAYDEGKAIEWRYASHSSTNDTWNVTNDPVWNWADYDYRVKPEKKVPVYRRWKGRF